MHDRALKFIGVSIDFPTKKPVKKLRLTRAVFERKANKPFPQILEHIHEIVHIYMEKVLKLVLLV